MPEIVSFEDVRNMYSVARDFSVSLSCPDNKDIAKDFPGTVRRYTGAIGDVCDELIRTREKCQNGKREQFIIYAGHRAVGLAAIQLVDEPPNGIDGHIPNLSGMIFNPWRGKGLGDLSLKHRLGIVDERFDGTAYSLVRKDNIVSRKLVESNGLFAIAEDDSRLTYLYNKDH